MAGKGLIPVSAGKLSDSRIKIVLSEIDKRCNSITRRLDTEAETEVHGLCEKHNLSELQSKVLEEKKSKEDQVTLLTIEDKDIRLLRDETFNTSQRELSYARDLKIEETKDRHKKEIERINQDCSEKIARLNSRKDLKKADSHSAAIIVRISDLNTDAITLSKVHTALSYVSSNQSLQTSEDLAYTGAHKAAITKLSKAISDIANRQRKIEVNNQAINDDIRLKVLVSGVSTGIDHVLSALPSARQLNEFDFKGLEKAVLVATTTVEQIPVLAEGGG